MYITLDKGGKGMPFKLEQVGAGMTKTKQERSLIRAAFLFCLKQRFLTGVACGPKERLTARELSLRYLTLSWFRG